jgi:hypothetical protein
MNQMDVESKIVSDFNKNSDTQSENNKNGTKFFDSNNDSHSEEKNDLFSHYNGNNNFPLDFHNDKSQNNYCSFYIFKENYNKNDDELDMNDKSFIEQNNNLENINENIKNINTITLSTGKVINTINQIMSNVMNELFNSNEIDYEKKK